MADKVPNNVPNKLKDNPLFRKIKEKYSDKIVIGIIPARLGSEEIHAKVLEDLGGKPVIQHVYEHVIRSGLFNKVIVAADHERIIKAAQGFGAETFLTKEDHICGSSRCAEAVRDIKNVKGDIIVNIQADEPFLNPIMLYEVVLPLLENLEIDMSTLCCKFIDKEASESIFNVKVVKSAKSGNALYFSRSLIPYERKKGISSHFHHIGIYGFKYDALIKFYSAGPSELELIEGLEQLRALQNGLKIRVVETQQDYKRIAIDTPEDLEKARKIIKEL